MSLLQNDGARRLVFDAVRRLQARFFRYERFGGLALVVEASEKEVIRVLAEAGYIHPWLFCPDERGDKE